VKSVTFDFVKFKQDCLTKMRKLEEFDLTSASVDAKSRQRFQGALDTLTNVLGEFDNKLLCGNMRVRFELRTPKVKRAARAAAKGAKAKGAKARSAKATKDTKAARPAVLTVTDLPRTKRRRR
jgi:hypothetical protein